MRMSGAKTGLLKRLHPTTSAVGPPPSGSGRNYGAHAAVSLALGFLFMGGGGRTFATDDASVAALVIALFPAFPASPTDQRCHLQVQLPVPDRPSVQTADV